LEAGKIPLTSELGVDEQKLQATLATQFYATQAMLIMPEESTVYEQFKSTSSTPESKLGPSSKVCVMRNEAAHC